MEIIFISVDNNHELYDKCVRNNPFITNNNNIKTVVFDNTMENKYISVRYNEFLNSYDYSNSRNSGGAWFVFCHNDWEILEDIEQKLNNLDTNAIYGPIGHRLYKRNENSYVMEWCGQCYERKKDGSNLRLLDAFHKDTGTPADVVDAQCMIVHSSLVEKYNLRFDEQFEYDLYVEDFMLAAKQNHNIPSRILNLKCCHYSELDNLCDRPAYFVQQKKFVKKYNNKEAGILVFYNFDNVCVEQKCLKRTNLTKESVNASKYDYKIDIYDFNSPMSIAFNKIPENSKVLDAGCSVGYFGELLAKYKNCIVTGMDYEEESLKAAEERNCYEELIHIDFNNFEPKDFPHLKEKFDYIVLLDVLEHLINPDAAIKKLGQFLKTGGKFMNRKNAVRLVSFCAAAVLAAAGFAVKSRLELERYRLEIQNTYSRSLDGLNSSVNNISLILEKAGYVTTAKQISNMAAQLLSEAESAKNSLSQLPSGQELTVLNRFLSQVGNYAMSVSKSLVENGSMSVVNAIYAMASRIVTAIEENGGDIYVEADGTATQNRRNRMYGKTLQYI